MWAADLFRRRQSEIGRAGIQRSAVFAAVPDAQDKDRGAGQLIAQLVIADDEATYIAWAELRKGGAHAGMRCQDVGRGNQLAHQGGCRRRADLGEKGAQPLDIAQSFAGPADQHGGAVGSAGKGRGKGVAVSRLAAQASTAA